MQEFALTNPVELLQNRNDAVDRARRWAPFLDDAAAAFPHFVETFLQRGSEVAVEEAQHSGVMDGAEPILLRMGALVPVIAFHRASTPPPCWKATIWPLSDTADQ